MDVSHFKSSADPSPDRHCTSITVWCDNKILPYKYLHANHCMFRPKQHQELQQYVCDLYVIDKTSRPLVLALMANCDPQSDTYSTKHLEFSSGPVAANSPRSRQLCDFLSAWQTYCKVATQPAWHLYHNVHTCAAPARPIMCCMGSSLLTIASLLCVLDLRRRPGQHAWRYCAAPSPEATLDRQAYSQAHEYS